MEPTEAKQILTAAAEQITDTVPRSWIMLLQALQRRVDYMETRKERGSKRPAPCKHATIQNELAIPNRPCKGRKVICLCEENPADDVYEAICRPEKCKFFTAEAEGK